VPRSRSQSFVAMVVLFLLPVLVDAGQAPQAMFRSKIAVVPVDVRIVDADGKPVSGLKAEEFVITEDGVRQDVKHFQEYVLVPGPVPAADAPPPLRGELAAAELAPPRGRIILILLGRGRLQEPSKGIDALLRFLREQLLPQDRVAIMAWNRATRFTTDHSKLVALLSRLQAEHDRIEALLVHQAKGLQAELASGLMKPSPFIQKQIDTVFESAGGVVATTPTPVSVTEASRVEQDTREATLALERAELLSTQGIPEELLLRKEIERITDRYGTDFAQYVLDSAHRYQDLTALYTAIDYMRYLEGEKHLIFVTEFGIRFDRKDDDRNLSAMANDARVVIHALQTGGMAGPAPPNLGALAFGASVLSSMPPYAQQAPQAGVDRLIALADVSEQTGGISSTTAYAATGLDRIDGSTRAGYLLAYYPANTDWNGKYRKIDVKVTRPGVTVLFRHGYYGSEKLVPLDRRSFLSYNRMSSAAAEGQELKDLTIRAAASVTSAGGQATVSVEVAIDLRGVEFLLAKGRRNAFLHIAVFCADGNEKPVGEVWQKADLALKEETYQRMMRDGYVHRVQVPLKGKAKLAWVKAVVYDYAGDAVGSTIVRVK
jgi:VWFA-related protein